MQVPPVFSAIKKDGKKLYELARKGKAVEPEPRPVVIHEFEILDFDPPLAGFRARVSKGTYIRSLAFDFGRACGSGAYLNSLRRTRIGDLRVEDAMSIDDFLRWWTGVQQARREETLPEGDGATVI
jgi:tRNA pseudouridine55 synthase